MRSQGTGTWRNSIAAVAALLPSFLATACGIGGCEKHASDYSCDYVERRALYQVWYWRNVQADDERDNKMIGEAVGLRMCRDNAMRYGELIGEPHNDRAYICVLMDDGRPMEKHRL